LKLLVGLGNPGSEYERTRHNVGFMVADRVARRLGAAFTAKKFGAEIAEAEVRGDKVLVVKPQTFMNHSGEPVGAVARFYKVPADEVVVAHDDLELEPFRVQVKKGGGHGGNNGLRSVNAHLGTPDYVRVRVGIGRPPHPSQSAGWVLAKFPKGFEGPLEECVELATDAMLLVASEGAVKAMNEFNRRKQPA
jgi:PTH1 family peptidyl-tRNA hydrolase